MHTPTQIHTKCQGLPISVKQTQHKHNKFRTRCVCLYMQTEVCVHCSYIERSYKIQCQHVTVKCALKHPSVGTRACTPLHSHSPSETGPSATSLVEFPGRRRLASYSSFWDLTRHEPSPPHPHPLPSYTHIHKQCASKHASRLLL